MYLKFITCLFMGFFVLKTHAVFCKDLLEKKHQTKIKDNFDQTLSIHQEILQYDPDSINVQAALSDLETQNYIKTLPLQCQKFDVSYDINKRCAKDNFIVRGKPICPFIIEQFQDFWNPEIASINLIDPHVSNGGGTLGTPFHKNYVVKKYKDFFEVTIQKKIREYFNYKIEGKTNNNIFIIKTTNYSNSILRQTILFVRIYEQIVFNTNNTSNLFLDRKLNVEVLGKILIEDNFYINIKLEDNKVVIQKKSILNDENVSEIMVINIPEYKY